MTGSAGGTSPAGVELRGRDVAAAIRAETAELVAAARGSGRPAPRLAVVVATADEATLWYVRSIAKAAESVGITCDLVDLGPAARPREIRAALERLAADPGVHGVMLQTPLPEGASAQELAAVIDPAKDVDGANPLSLGRLAAGLPAFAPATAAAVMALLDRHGVPLRGARAVVVGRSTVVGKPLAHLLLDRHCTVTVCHSRTRDLASVTSTAEVLVAAAGRAGLIGAEHVAPGAVVIDVGTNPTPDGGLTGDVDFGAVVGRAGALTPVPGGVGPVTTAILLRHTARAAGLA
ncbi:bifunctional 5,10-methylenetetrahydrofolate dehydrogenase/5,10-methenyltetrahydrofolate cyclohydrolase [Nonomuraea sp. NPDC047897]|uniref:bifunctional 5,10-methylenetetrahydrofolate dehydrogenase/5,10-methenyltetrahydrofolate cyclohydrolase n=1 Tax=Nonomuraea sp. NPDC047897 TaxID=3364346 RepID=UPI00371BED56